MSFSSAKSRNTNFILTEREGRTGEYWAEVMTVRTERSEARTKTTKGQYSPVRLEQVRLVSSLLYWHSDQTCQFFLLKRTSGHLNSKGFRRDVFLMTWQPRKNKPRYYEFENKFTESFITEYKQDFKNDL